MRQSLPHHHSVCRPSGPPHQEQNQVSTNSTHALGIARQFISQKIAEFHNEAPPSDCDNQENEHPLNIEEKELKQFQQEKRHHNITTKLK